jgi:hypothetical protein
MRLRLLKTSYILFAVLVFCTAAKPATSTLRWSPLVRNVQVGMDTPEPPDGHYPTNITGCAWNDEDELGVVGSGSLAGTSTGSVCLVSDFATGSPTPYPKAVIFRVSAPKNTLSVSLSNDVGDSWQSPPPFVYKNQYWWQLCIQDPVATRKAWDGQDTNTWPLIPGTDGYGQIVNYTLSVTSTRNTTNKVSAFLETAYSQWPGGPSPVIQTLAQFPGEVPCP